ncbi:hypothetical protein Pmani_039600 [Petrolisthes manimaculis]|uniref:Uncharacterized protein n=1 Tax=Petrolisthes manimaculis TaxID=1843537 RepID=A0AAE1NEU6_9EUCA|nr:hypothetical protein Pmani_039600 [Petrolisthes manimaculis]
MGTCTCRLVGRAPLRYLFIRLKFSGTDSLARPWTRLASRIRHPPQDSLHIDLTTGLPDAATTNPRPGLKKSTLVPHFRLTTHS